MDRQPPYRRGWTTAGASVGPPAAPGRPLDSPAWMASRTGGAGRRRHRVLGVVRVDRDGEVRLAKTYGLAHRGWGAANTVDTRFVIASGTRA